ncbi:uncharacterized protein Z519_02973 [Cladophialophora bantiana CBS 173.52]|uniref:BZIP domain-containing protein n=1 Tax=Cladophialophora bantiana (strain ATCC 10958 / CBS 173.52 / CDC B-1940 / NIH 8579) TaxID=1442370 RepID=A0A0D2GBH7_CLAB1|nr:uncharacterized protein Z519_02973 [Cladophialophora bantiana CBS 173.52]KIW95907.1 hypothetical protein Z519_02973 [Cladophialophora bantiana CBS 173.52]
MTRARTRATDGHQKMQMETPPSRVVFERRLPTETRREDDDWAGLSDARARRRIQNRLNQRSYRRRRAAERQAKRASAACRLQKPVSLAPRKVVPTADQKGNVKQTASGGDALLPNNTFGQVTLRSQTELQQITSPVQGCAVLLANHGIRRDHHYARTILWPSFKHYSLKTNESLTSAFFHLSMVDHLLLNSFVWTAALAMSMHLPHTAIANDAVMFACQARAVQSIREHIDQDQVTDSVIFAVLALTIRDTDPRIAAHEVGGGDHCFGGFDPPLRSLGWIHALWLREVVYNISTPGVAEQIQSTDILQASLSLCRPNFTLCHLYQHVLENHVKMIRPPRERLDEAFPTIHDVDFKDLLLDMRMYCRELERIAAESGGASEGGGGGGGDGDAAANDLYRLLRLPRYENREEELCRLAAMIFSYGVIYPVARPRPLRVLAKQLRNEVEDRPCPPSMATCNGPMLAGRGEAFLLWIAVLGALASKNCDDDEAFFIHLVATCSATLEVVDFVHLRALVCSFLWLAGARDEGAYHVWTKVRSVMEEVRDSNVCLHQQQEQAQETEEEKEPGVVRSMHLVSLICTL